MLERLLRRFVDWYEKEIMRRNIGRTRPIKYIQSVLWEMRLQVTLWKMRRRKW